MTQWVSANQNVVIKVHHGEEVYYNNIETKNANNQKVVKTYHTIDNKPQVQQSKDKTFPKIIGYQREVVYYASYKVMGEGHWDGDKPVGLWKI